jgi:hypothetical protein
MALVHCVWGHLASVYSLLLNITSISRRKKKRGGGSSECRKKKRKLVKKTLPNTED